MYCLKSYFYLIQLLSEMLFASYIDCMNISDINVVEEVVLYNNILTNNDLRHVDICSLALVNKKCNDFVKKTKNIRKKYIRTHFFKKKYIKIIREKYINREFIGETKYYGIEDEKVVCPIIWHAHASACAFILLKRIQNEIDVYLCTIKMGRNNNIQEKNFFIKRVKYFDVTISKDKKYGIFALKSYQFDREIHITTWPPFFNKQGDACICHYTSDKEKHAIQYSISNKKVFEKCVCWFETENKIYPLKKLVGTRYLKKFFKSTTYTVIQDTGIKIFTSAGVTRKSKPLQKEDYNDIKKIISTNQWGE